MRLTRNTGTLVGVDAADVLRAAGVIYAARRTHGGPARKMRPCRWCDIGVAGRAALVRHDRECPRWREWVRFYDADLQPWSWDGDVTDE